MHHECRLNLELREKAGPYNQGVGVRSKPGTNVLNVGRELQPRRNGEVVIRFKAILVADTSADEGLVLQFPWRWNRRTIALELGVIWEMSVEIE